MSGPYEEAWRLIAADPYSAGSTRLATLLLFLSDVRRDFVFKEDEDDALPPNVVELSKRIATQFVEHSHRRELNRIAQRIMQRRPELGLDGQPATGEPSAMIYPAAGNVELSPYLQALRYIDCHSRTPMGEGFVKLLLSFWNWSNAFSWAECTHEFDEEATDLALRVTIHFANFGLDRELRDIGYRLCEQYPEIFRLGQLGRDGKRAGTGGAT